MPGGQLSLPGVTGQNYVATDYPKMLPQWLYKINLRTIKSNTGVITVFG
jgi:hypothetical protein